MGTPDVIALIYFVYIVIAALAVREVPARRRIAVAALSLCAIGAVIVSGRLWPPDSGLRICLPAVWLVVGYWLPGGLLHEPMPALEAWLRASDRWLLDPRLPALNWLATLFEVAYGLVHPFVAAGLLVVVLSGHDVAASFWTPVLLAGYACYGTLPWLQARPPRLLEAALLDATAAALPMAEEVRRATGTATATAKASVVTAPAGFSVALTSAMAISPAALAAQPVGIATATTSLEVAARDPRQPPLARVRIWNERLLDRVSVHANTFPSGHVAVAFVVALVVADLAPAAGILFVPFALLIATATVVRRYHYTADVAFGLAVALLCWTAARLAS